MRYTKVTATCKSGWADEILFTLLQFARKKSFSQFESTYNHEETTITFYCSKIQELDKDWLQQQFDKDAGCIISW